MRLAEPGDLTRPTQAVGVSQRHEATRAPAGLGARLSRTHARRTPSNRKPALAAHRREEGRESIFHIRLLGLGLAVCRHGEFSRAAGVDSDYWARAIALSEHSRERDVLLPQVFLCRRSLMPTDTRAARWDLASPSLAARPAQAWPARRPLPRLRGAPGSDRRRPQMDAKSAVVQTSDLRVIHEAVVELDPAHAGRPSSPARTSSRSRKSRLRSDRARRSRS
jgi:hypothetical protein